MRQNQFDGFFGTKFDILKPRWLPTKAGCALGAIYNLVEDMDEIVLRVGTRTLGRLDEALSKAAARRPLNLAADAIERLVRIAIAYCRFAATNKNLWRALFEHQMANEKPVPTWFVENRCVYSNTPRRLSAY